MKNLWLIFCAVCLRCDVIFSQDISVLDHGALPDSSTLNTRAIQSAIDFASQQGGGRVVIPPGKFLTGSLVLKSRVELHLEKGAVLLGSTNPGDYIKLNRWKAIILSDGQDSVAITGPGEIDGQGRKLALYIDSLFYAGKIDSINYNFVEMRPKEPLRPQLIEMVNCKRVMVRDVFLKDGSGWVQTYERCENVAIENIRVVSDAYWNNDGMDIVDCRKVRISGCYVNSADDGICLKSVRPGDYCDSIEIANCTVRSSASAIKFGTASNGGFRNVHIHHIKVYDTFRSAIAIETVDGGNLENIRVNDIDAANTGNAFFIRLGHRNASGLPGMLRNVSLSNFRVDIAYQRPDYQYDIRGPELPFFHNVFPASITGIPGYEVENVSLSNIEIWYPGRGNDGLANLPLWALDRVPEQVSAYPEFSMFRELPAWGLYVRHVRGLHLENVRMRIDAPDYRPAMVFDDVQYLKLENLQIDGDMKKESVVLYKTEHVETDDVTGVLKK